MDKFRTTIKIETLQKSHALQSLRTMGYTAPRGANSACYLNFARTELQRKKTKYIHANTRESETVRGAVPYKGSKNSYRDLPRESTLQTARPLIKSTLGHTFAQKKNAHKEERIMIIVRYTKIKPRTQKRSESLTRQSVTPEGWKRTNSYPNKPTTAFTKYTGTGTHIFQTILWKRETPP